MPPRDKEWRELPDDEEMLSLILDETNQMIQLSDLETFRMLYANKPARSFALHRGEDYHGKHCYEYMMGLKEPCPYCPMRTLGDRPSAETEVDNGNQIYAVKTNVFHWKGKKVFMEYAWDITEIRRSQRIFESQMKLLLQSIPEAQGILHFDLTADVCLSLNGAAKKNMSTFPTHSTVNHTLRHMVSFIPSPEEREAMYEKFCREAMMESYEKGNVEISRDTISYFDDGSIRAARVIARLQVNPSNDHMEAILYGLDISSEVKEKENYEVRLRQQLTIFHALARDFLNVFLIHPDEGQVYILKMDGFVVPGLIRGTTTPYRFDDAVQEYVKSRVHPEDQARILETWQIPVLREKLKEAPEYVGNYRTLIDGKTHYYRYRFVGLEGSNQIIAGFQNIDAIISDEKEKKETLAKALQAANQSSQAKTTFLNSVSHDIRTPLNAITGFTVLAMNHVNDPEMVKNYLSKVTVASNHLLALINDVLDMSRIESGHLELEEKPVSLAQIFQDLETIIQNDIKAKGIRFFGDMKNLSHPYVLMDPMRMKKVLLNILSNATKFTNEGGEIHFCIEEMESPEDGKGLYRFHIRDTGIGMSKGYLAHIFEPFSREETATVSGIPGTGLGMSIASRIVKLMGGTIDVTSEVGKGSHFIVTVPATQLVEETPDREEPEEKLEKIIEGKRVLLVEDNELNREICQELLEMAGFTVDTAEDGKVAVDRVREAPAGTYDVILMDIQMPVMDGYEATREIRCLVEGKKAGIPIFALTANAFAEDRRRAIEAGMNGHIAKPIDIPSLMKTLRNV